jgi:hypothetical protein
MDVFITLSIKNTQHNAWHKHFKPIMVMSYFLIIMFKVVMISIKKFQNVAILNVIMLKVAEVFKTICSNSKDFSHYF